MKRTVLDYSRIFWLSMKPPKLVITDGAKALTKSSDNFFSCHRLRCSWSLWRNLAQRYCGQLKKNLKLKITLEGWFRTYDRSKFENFSTELKTFLQENDGKYLQKLYDIKTTWARAFNSSVFTANTLITSRNESWNSKIKRSLSSFSDVSDLVSVLLEIDSNSIYWSEKPLVVELLIFILLAT